MAAHSTNLSAYLRKFKNGKQLVESVADKYIKEYAENVSEYVVTDWPIDTGLSKSNFILIKKGNADYVLVNDTNYVTYVHLGLIFRKTKTGVQLFRKDMIDSIQKDISEGFSV